MGYGANIKIHAAAAVTYAGGAVPAYLWQSGAFTGVITDNGVGDAQLLMNANDGVDAAEGCILLSARTFPNVPRQVALAHVNTTDISKQILVTEEAAAGAISIPADADFDIVILKERHT